MKVSTTLLILLSLSLTGCGEGKENIDNQQSSLQQNSNDQQESLTQQPNYGLQQVSGQQSPNQPVLQQQNPIANNADQQILIVDRGLNMPIGRLIFPPGWSVRYDIVSNLQTSAYDRFIIDIYGPDGSLIRGMGVATYHHSRGTNFDAIVETMALAGAQGIEQLSYGTFSVNQRALARPKYQQAVQKARAQGYQFEPLHLSFQGIMSGRKIEGRLEVDHSIFLDRGQHIGGSVNVVLLMSPPGRMDTLVRISDAISDRFQANPNYDRARSQLIDSVTARQYSEHKRRMANNQAQFNAHQQMMQGRYDSAYAQNKQWQQNFNNSGAANSSNNGYSNHDKFIDSIHETTSFIDPNSGSRTSQDGQYNHWATDGQGNYVGSNNPNFNPNALPGHWQEAKPLK